MWASASVCLVPDRFFLVLIYFLRCIRRVNPYPRTQVGRTCLLSRGVLFPEVEAKVRAELDAVVGSKRFPSSNDRDSLPYIDTVSKRVSMIENLTPDMRRNRYQATNGILSPRYICQ